MDNENGKIAMEETLSAEELTNPETLAKYVVSILDAKKARDLKLLHVEARTVIADYFVICTGNSRTQIRALADEIEFKLDQYGIKPRHVEGTDSGIWVLQDYGSVIIHIFSGDAREFYNLEKLYQDTTEEDISEIITED